MVRAAIGASEAGGLVRRALCTEDIDRTLRSRDAVDVVAVGGTGAAQRAAIEFWEKAQSPCIALAY